MLLKSLLQVSLPSPSRSASVGGSFSPAQGQLQHTACSLYVHRCLCQGLRWDWHQPVSLSLACWAHTAGSSGAGGAVSDFHTGSLSATDSIVISVPRWNLLVPAPSPSNDLRRSFPTVPSWFPLSLPATGFPFVGVLYSSFCIFAAITVIHCSQTFP